jgi:DNA polymerase V
MILPTTLTNTEAWTPRKNIQSSRAFGQPITQLRDLTEAVSSYTASACEKLRGQGGLAHGLTTFLQTSRFKPPCYSLQQTLGFSEPTSDTRLITRYAIAAIKAMYRPGLEYTKCGILLLDIIPNTYQQGDLLPETIPASDPKLMQIMDTINQKYGRQSIRLAAEGFKRIWQMKAINRSPRYTTCWDELVIVNSGYNPYTRGR